MARQTTKHLLALLLCVLTAACSATPSEPANSNAAPPSPVAQSGTTPANVDAAPAQSPAVAVVPPATDPKAAIPQVSTGPAAQPAGPAPKLVVASTRIDFGKQPKDKTIAKTISLSNGGKAPLTITAVEPSCGCTTVDFPKLIKPGRSGSIKIKVETGSSPGEHTKSLTIKSNDPVQPSLKLEFVYSTK